MCKGHAHQPACCILRSKRNVETPRDMKQGLPLGKEPPVFFEDMAPARLPRGTPEPAPLHVPGQKAASSLGLYHVSPVTR